MEVAAVLHTTKTGNLHQSTREKRQEWALIIASSVRVENMQTAKILGGLRRTPQGGTAMFMFITSLGMVMWLTLNFSFGCMVLVQKQDQPFPALGGAFGCTWLSSKAAN
jgi:hypothetical protein